MLEQKLTISNLNKLKITKVRNSKIFFEYTGKKYEIRINTVNKLGVRIGICVSIFERIPRIEYKGKKLTEQQRSGQYNDKFIATNREIIPDADVNLFLKDVSKKYMEHHTYSNLDKEYFVKQLTIYGLADGIYEDEYKQLTNDISDIDIKIEALKKEKDKIKAKFIKTKGHGSKCYSKQLKVKISERNIDKAHKNGEYYEPFLAYFGDKYVDSNGKETEATLRDLRSLPYGTCIYVHNGEFSAYIGCNEHGDKTVVTDNGEVVITEDHCAAYVTVVLGQ